MAAEECEPTSTTTVPAAAEEQPISAERPVGVEGSTRWEFRLTADRRRILIPVERASAPEFA
jgi:hypothetical protein